MNGTLLIVSHDRYFIIRLADKVAVIAGGEICVYAGNYEQYLEKKNNGNRKETIKYEKPEVIMKRKNLKRQRNVKDRQS